MKRCGWDVEFSVTVENLHLSLLEKFEKRNELALDCAGLLFPPLVTLGRVLRALARIV